MYVKLSFLTTLIVMLAQMNLAVASNCLEEKERFKELYIALQQSLNYNGKDAHLENGKLVLKPHNPNAPYEGKVFEEALYKEYQLALKKVAAVYQAAKFEKFDSSNKALVDFMKAVEGNDSQMADYIKSNKVNVVIDQLQEASLRKFSDEKNPARLTNNDKYLLKKLLTHAQDRLCSITQFEEREAKTGKQQNSKHFSADELNRIRNAPLNRLINSIKNGKIEAQSDLKIEELKDSEKAINLAIAKNMQALRDWKAKNEKCLKHLANPSFIQSGIQTCNYSLFVKALDGGNENNIEAILHFINANEKFLKSPEAIAETALDELKLEVAIDRTFNDTRSRLENCPAVKQKSSRIFVSNLKFSEKAGFDTSYLKLSCSKSGKSVDSAQCEKSIEFISDKSGEGVEVKLRQPGMQLKVETNESCQSEPALVVSRPTIESCKQDGENQSPKIELTVSSDGESCVPKSTSPSTTAPLLTTLNTVPAVIPPTLNRPGVTNEPAKTDLVTDPKPSQRPSLRPALRPSQRPVTETPDVPKAEVPEAKKEKTAEECIEQGKSENKALVIALDKLACTEEKTEAICEEESKTQNKKLIPNKDKNACVEEKTQAICDEEGKTSNKKLILSSDKLSCEEAKKEKTQAQCDEEGKAKNKTLILSSDKFSCEEKSSETKKEKTQAICDEEGKTKNKNLMLSADKLSCEEKPVAAKKDDKDLCTEKNDEWLAEQAKEGNPPTSRYKWDTQKKVCVDKQAKESEEDEEEDDTPTTRRQAAPGSNPPPARFQPVQIPTRQMYILPGMP